MSSKAANRQRSNSLQTATIFNSVPLLLWPHFLRSYSWQLHEASRRNSLRQPSIRTGHDQVPNSVFAWRRLKKLLGSSPIYISVSTGKPGGTTGSSHQGGSSPFKGRDLASCLRSDLWERQRMDIFRLNHFISRAISRRPGPSQERRPQGAERSDPLRGWPEGA